MASQRADAAPAPVEVLVPNLLNQVPLVGAVVVSVPVDSVAGSFTASNVFIVVCVRADDPRNRSSESCSVVVKPLIVGVAEAVVNRPATFWTYSSVLPEPARYATMLAIPTSPVTEVKVLCAVVGSLAPLKA